MRSPSRNLELASASSDNPLLERWREIMIPYYERREQEREVFRLTGKFPPFEMRALDPFTKRHELVMAYAWAIPTDEALQVIEDHSPEGVVEIGAGSGYWAMLLRERGLPVAAYDSEPYESFQVKAKWSEVAVGGPEKASEWPERTLFLCWPPYDTPMAHESLLAYAGSTLVYIGEGYGGCTGDDAFHNLLENEWELAQEVAIPQWEGLHDYLQVYKRR